MSRKFDDEEDDGVLDSWEAAGDSDEEKETTPSAPTRNRVGVQERIAQREAKEQEERERKAIEAAMEDPKLKKERQKAAELQSDLKNASDLFADLHVHPRERANKAEPAVSPAPAGPTKLSDLPIFKPKSKQEFDNLRKTLVPLLTSLQEQNSLQFANFITDFCRDCCKPLSSDQSRKVASTISAVSNEKQREERLNRGKKQKPMVKQASQKVDEVKDTTNFDDFDDDDFM